MKKVNIIDSWGHFSYTLGGKKWEPVAGTEVQVLWPSGKVSKETLRKQVVHTSTPDHGTIYNATSEQFYLLVSYEGVELKVPLEKVSVGLLNQ